MGIQPDNPINTPRLYPISRPSRGTDHTPHKTMGNPGSFLDILTKASGSPEPSATRPESSPSDLKAQSALELSQKMALQMNESLLRIVFETEGENPLEDSFLGNLKNLLSQGADRKSFLSTSRHSPSENQLPGIQEAEQVVETTIQTRKDAPGIHGIDRIIQKAAQAHGVDPELIRGVIQAESDFNPKAISSKGAMGLMQLMPKTAKELGVTDPLNPVENVMGGTRYLKKLLDRYDGNVHLALAAYNWGMGNLDSRRKPMPEETKNYVAKITGIAIT